MQMSDLFAVANLASGVKIISRHDIYSTYGEKNTSVTCITVAMRPLFVNQ